MRICLALILLLAFNIVSAQTFNSNGGGDWDDPNSWDVGGGQTPGTGDIVNIINGDVINVNFTTTVTVADLTINASTLQFTAASGQVQFSNDFVAIGAASITGTSVNHLIVATTSAGSFTVNASAVLNVTIARLTISTKPTVLSGELRFTTGVSSSNTLEDLTINSGGTFNNNTTQDFIIAGNILNNSSNSFTGCSTGTDCAYTMTSSSGTISGTGTTNIADFVIDTPGSITNNGNVVMTNDITGTGTFINGATGTLTLSEDGTYSVSTLTLNTVGNTVIYDGTVADILLPGPFYDVQVNMDVATTIIQMNGGDVAIDNDLTVTSGRVRLMTANTLTVGGDVIIQANGEFEPNVASSVANIGGNVTLTDGLYDQNNGTVNVTGDYTVNSGTMTFNNGASILDVNGTYNVVGGTNDFTNGTFTPEGIDVSAGQAILFGGITLTAGGTTLINGTMTIDGSTGDKNFAAVTLANAGDLNFLVNENLDISGALSMSGTSSITGTGGSQIVNANSTMAVTSGTGTIGGIQFNVTGTTTLDGTLAFSDIIGIKTFGNVVVGATGTWDNSAVTEVFTFTGDLTNNGGTWNGCADGVSCLYTMTANPNGTISGTGIFNVTDFVINTGTTITNLGNVVLTDDITGTGTFINGATGTLTLSENGFYSISTLTLNTVGNTVIFSGSVADQIEVDNSTPIGPFYDLEINMDASTIQADMAGQDVTVNNDMTITRGRVRLQTANTLSVTGNLTITTDGELRPNNIDLVTNIGGGLLMAGGIYDHNNGDVNVSGDITVTGGTMTMNESTSTSTLDGTNFSVSDATVTLSEGILTLTGDLTISNSGNNVNVLNTTNIAGTLISNSGSLNLNSGADVMANAVVVQGGIVRPNSTTTIFDITTDLTITSGQLDHNNGDVNISGDLLISSTGVMTMNGTTSTVDATDLTMTNGTVTLVEGTLTVSNAVGGITLNTGAQLTGNTTSTLLVTNNMTINGGGYSPNATGHTGTISGDIVLTSGTYDHNLGAVTATNILISSTSIMTMDGATSTIDAVNFTMTDGLATLTEGTLSISGAGMNVNGGLVRLAGAHTLVITNDMVIAGGEFEPNNIDALINIGGNLSVSSGAFDQNDGDVNVTGDLVITGGIMTMNEGSTLGESTVDATDMSIATGSVMLTEGALTLSNAAGGLLVTSGTLTTDGTAHALSIAGDYDIQGGASDLNAGTIGFVNMDITGAGTINIIAPIITSTGTITVDNGSFSIDGLGGTYTYNNITVNAGGTWVATVPYDPTINGNLANNGGTFTGCSNTTGCDYTLTSTSGTISGTGAMTSMSDFILNDNASYTNTNSGGVEISDRLATTSGTGTFINGVNGVISYTGSDGNFSVSSFTASANPNTVTYNRTSSTQTIEPTADGFYHNLTIDKADGINAATSSEITVNGVLTMTLGDLVMGNDNLIMADGATISGGSATSYIQDNNTGVLRQFYAGAGATLSFPLGDGVDYSPITAFTINSATFGASPFLEFQIRDFDHPNRNTDNTAAGGDDDGTAAVAFISRYWTVSPNDITDPSYDASYTYVDADITGTEANMIGTVYRTPPGEAFLDWSVDGTVNATNNTVSISGSDAFGDMYAMDNTTERLPIALMGFDVDATESCVNLKWVTASEENNDFFTIERSKNGREFTPMLTVGGAANSDTLINYSAIDDKPLNGLSFYRLKQTDFNGQFEYSEMRSVVFEREETDLDFSIYPNPVSTDDILRIKVPSQINLDALNWKFLDASGRSIQLTYEVANNHLVIGAGTLKRGIYMIRATDGVRSVTKKVMVR